MLLFGEVEGCLESYPKVRAAIARVYVDEQGQCDGDRQRRLFGPAARRRRSSTTAPATWPPTGAAAH